MTEIDDLEAELQTNVQIGSDSKITSEFYQPLDALAKWFVAPGGAPRVARSADLRRTTLEIADFRDREVEGDIDVGRNLGNWGEIRVGLHRINGLTYDYFGNPDLVDPQYNNGEYFFKFSYDQLDNVHFPREGQSFNMQWDANRTNLGADTAFDRVSVDWLAATLAGSQHAAAVDLGRRDPGRPAQAARTCRISIRSAASSTYRGSRRNPCSARTTRSRARSISARSAAAARASSSFRSYVGASLELGNTWERRSEISYGSAHKDASVFIAFDTFLGPVYLGSGYDQTGNAGYYLFLGRTF